ncbi:MAG: hypothetical protein R3C24_18040 [Cyanobacteriota/Melainabacteria group bacterium]|nr:hypothetical protein [Candidatus Obscuribacterales bacterium]
MGLYFARIFKAMLVSAIGFGGGIGLLFMIIIIIVHNGPDKFYLAMKAGLCVGGVFSLLYVFLLLLLDLTSKLYYSRGHFNEIWEVQQTRELTMKGPSKQVLAFCREALLAVPYVKAVTEDAENMVARASTGTSWRSPGEVIEVEVNPLAEDEWKVTIMSRPENKDNFFDYGKNFVNVEVWFSKVTQLEQERDKKKS